MATKPGRWCAVCRKPHPSSESCPLKPKHNWASKQQGTTTTARGYGADWRRRRKPALERDNYLCQPCFKNNKLVTANIVDHVIPKSEGGTDHLDNLQIICKDCHKDKTLEESKRSRHGVGVVESLRSGGQ